MEAVNIETGEIQVIEAKAVDADLQIIGNALAEYTKVDAGLAELGERYRGVHYDVITREGMAAAVGARRELRGLRVRVEDVRKEAKAPLLALGRRLDTEAKRITAALSALEDPIDGQIAAETQRKEAERRAKEESERARLAEIHKRMAAIEAMPERFSEATAARLTEVIAQLEAGLTFNYEEFAEHAEALRQNALTALRAMQATALEREQKAAAEAAECAQREADAKAAREAEEKRLADERRRLAEERAAEDSRQAAERKAERERQAAEQAEQRRIAEIQERIAELRGNPMLTAQDKPELIAEHIRDLESIVVDDSFAGFRDLATSTKAAGLEKLRALHQAATARVIEEARLREERSELDRQRRQADERERVQREESERVAREKAEREAAEAREAAEKQAAQERRDAMRSMGRPDASTIADAVAEAFGVDSDIAAGWIAEIAHDEWVAIAAATA